MMPVYLVSSSSLSMTSGTKPEIGGWEEKNGKSLGNIENFSRIFANLCFIHVERFLSSNLEI